MEKLILGHRGYSEIAPENTKLAFDSAFDFGFDGIEIDVHKTKDNELVVIHDESINRTSDGKGLIKEKTLEELRKRNFTYRFNKTIPKQKILTFKEFLKIYGNKFKVINVEVKTDIEHYEGIEKDILDIHNQVKTSAKIIYSSFNFKTIQILRKLDKNIQLGFLFTESYELYDILEEVKDICNYIHPWFKTLLDKRSLEYYVEKVNLPIITWTVDKNEVGDWWTAGSSSVIEKLKRISLIEAIISNSRI